MAEETRRERGRRRGSMTFGRSVFVGRGPDLSMLPDMGLSQQDPQHRYPGRLPFLLSIGSPLSTGAYGGECFDCAQFTNEISALSFGTNFF